MEIFEEEFEKIVPSASDNAIKLTDCVVIDNDNDQHIIRRCNNAGVRNVGQLSGMWEVNEISRLGICLRHLNYDQNTVHKPGSGRRIKAVRTTEESIITSRRCLFCKKLKCFLTRGKTCSIHAWKVCVIHGGHLHIQPGRGKQSVSCLERGQHDTDTTFALKLFSGLNKLLHQIIKP